jgi:hypothetical protein
MPSQLTQDGGKDLHLAETEDGDALRTKTESLDIASLGLSSSI